MPPGVEVEVQLSQGVLRGLGDKLYDKRKLAALEVEQLVKNLAREGSWKSIEAILDRLTEDYAYSPQANWRKGGLLALAAAAVALAERKQESATREEVWGGPDFLAVVVPPVLNSLVDADARVRYYACEALYNIAKVARDDFLEPHFNCTFDALFRLVADPDPAVTQATSFLDVLMKDIVTAHEHFNMDEFAPQFREALQVTAPRKRAFLLSWMQVLASVPDLDMLAYLPLFLDRLFDCLKDPLAEVRAQATKVLQDLLLEVQTTDNVDYEALASVLVEAARNPDDRIKLTALRWLRTFVADAKGAILPQCAALLTAILPALASVNLEIQQVARDTNTDLLQLPAEWEGQSRPGELFQAVASELQSPQEPTRLAALHWLNTLLSKSRSTILVSLDVLSSSFLNAVNAPSELVVAACSLALLSSIAQVLVHLDVLLPSLLDALHAPSERVVVEALAVQAAVAEDPEHFPTLMTQLLDRFRGQSGAKLLQRRGTLVVRRLCARLGGRAVLSGFSRILEAEADLPFAAAIVQALNMVLLTAPELRDLRALLQRAGHEPEGAELFTTLYRSWSHSIGAALALTFLAQAYGHAYDIACSFSELPLGVEALVQIDRLVQLLETPAFTSLRLQLLHPARFPALMWSLSALLMLLPQTEAFRTLHARLHSVPADTLLKLQGPPAAETGPEAWAGFSQRKSSSVDTAGLRPTTSGSFRGPEQDQIAPWQSAPKGEAKGAIRQVEKPSVDFGPLLELFRDRQTAHTAEEAQRRNQGQDLEESARNFANWEGGFMLPGPISSGGGVRKVARSLTEELT